MKDVVLERPSTQVEWVVDASASADEVAAVSQIAHEEGLPGRVNPTLSYKSVGDVPWWVILLVFANFTFFKGFLNEAGRDSYQGLRRLISRLFNARRDAQGTVRIKVAKQITTIQFTADLPEQAFTMLAKIDLDTLENDFLYWDADQGRWRHLKRRSE